MNTQTDLFKSMIPGKLTTASSGVGVQETSREAYYENREAKGRMVKMVVQAVRDGHNCLLAIHKKTGIVQSSVSGRVNDAIRLGLLKYDGYVVYDKVRRKRIVLA